MSCSDPERQKGVTTFFDCAPCYAAVIDRQYNVETTNICFLETFGEASGRSCYSACKGKEQPCEGCPAARVFSDGLPHQSEQQGVSKDGRSISYDVQAVPLFDEDGVVERVLLVGLDTTALVELRKELNQADQLATVGLTTVSLAHTLKNILAGLDGVIYLVDSGIEKGDSDRIKSGWDMAKGYVEQVNHLLKNLLHYVQAPETKREEISPCSLIREMYELYADKAELAGIELETIVDDGLPSILLDRRLIHSCLANLVSNAIDACMWDPDQEKKHKIIIKASRGSDDRIAFQVLDNGIGIAKENQTKILKAVFTTKGMRGTGLGLLLTKKVVQTHGGRLSFTSTPGQGTTFCLEF